MRTAPRTSAAAHRRGGCRWRACRPTHPPRTPTCITARPPRCAWVTAAAQGDDRSRDGTFDFLLWILILTISHLWCKIHLSFISLRRNTHEQRYHGPVFGLRGRGHRAGVPSGSLVGGCQHRSDRELLEEGGAIYLLRRKPRARTLPRRDDPRYGRGGSGTGTSRQQTWDFLARHVQGDWGEVGRLEGTTVTEEEVRGGAAVTDDDAKLNKITLHNRRGTAERLPDLGGGTTAADHRTRRRRRDDGDVPDEYLSRRTHGQGRLLAQFRRNYEQ